LFGLGALLYLAEAQKSSEVSSIASVSGGSLANGAVAQALDYRTSPAAEVETVVGDTGRQLATKGTVFGWRGTWLYLVLLVVVAAVVAVGPWLLPIPTALKIIVFLAGLLLIGLLAQLRGRVCARAFAETLFSPDGAPTQLGQIHTAVDHVICATDLHAGEHVYFSGRFVGGYRFGLGTPGDLPLHRAVQASAAFPGAFPVTWLPTSRHQFRKPAGSDEASATTMALVDGGVYDNMSDQWAQGLASRSRRWSQLSPEFREADELVVVNASAGLGWGSVNSLRWPLVGELTSLLRDKSVLYDNGNSLRRHELTARFDLAEREGRGLRGVLVHIPQDPFEVPDAFKGADSRWPGRAERARAALALLGDQPERRDEWRKIAAANATEATTLVRFKEEVCARLLYHAYVLTMVNTHVILDYPLLEMPDLDRFRGLVGQSKPA
jgi:hypothetical protein